MKSYWGASAVVMSVLALACGGDEGGESTDNTTGGTMNAPTGGSGGSGSGGDVQASNGGSSQGGTGGGSAAPMTWAGTWTASATYDVTCENGLAPAATDTGKAGNWTITISGANSSLEAVTSTNFVMQGNGNATSMTLNGEFPVRGTDDNLASTAADIDMNLSIDTMDDNDNVSGTLSGQFELTSNGAASNCTISNGTIELSR